MLNTMEIKKYNPAPRWINVLFNIEKYKFHSTIYIEYPLDYQGQMTSKYFIKWCNNTSKNNPIIFLKMPSNLQDMHTILTSIYNTISHINSSQNDCIARKMQMRYVQTGFPITIKTKCYNHNCSTFIPITTKYIGLIHKQIQTNCNQRQIFCSECKKKQSHNRQNDPQTCNLIDSFSNMMLDYGESSMTID